MPIPDVLYANDVDLSELDVDVLNLDGVWATFSTGRSRVSPAGSTGTIPSDAVSTPPFVWPLQLALVCDPDDRDTKLAALRKHLRGLVEWRLGESNLVRYGVVEGSGGAGRFGPIYVMQDGDGDLVLPLNVVCDDPARYDRYERTVSFSSTPVQISGGDLPMAGEVWVHGGAGATTPAINLRTPSGSVVLPKGGSVTMQLASLNNDESYQIILGSEYRIIFWNNGTPTFDLSKITAGWFFAPEDGDTLEVTAGYGEYVYQRAFK